MHISIKEEKRNMRYCTNCGHANEDGAKYCNNCGTLIQSGPDAKRERSEFDRRIDDFAQEMESIGKRIEREFEDVGKDFGRWSDSTLGILGPLAWSLVGLVVFVLIMAVMWIIGGSVHVFRDISDFFLANIWLIFALGLLFSYSNFFSRKYKERFRWVQPILTALGLVFALWLASEIMHIVAVNYDLVTIEDISSILSNFLWLIFMVVLIVGYVAFLVSLLSTGGVTAQEPRAPYAPPGTTPRHTAEGEYKRLYRSGRNRMIGGVCGGMGDYANIDPNIIRVIWIILLVVTFGLAIIAYFVCWIVIPRNPNDFWE